MVPLPKHRKWIHGQNSTSSSITEIYDPIDRSCEDECETAVQLADVGSTSESYVFLSEVDIVDTARYRRNWVSFLGAQNKPGVFRKRVSDYKGTNVSILKTECEKLSLRTGSTISSDDLELIFSLFCEREECDFDPLWCNILEMFIPLRMSIDDTFNMFYATITKFLPRNWDVDAMCYQLMRLVLQYHDPALNSHLESKKTTSFDYARSCFTSLLVGYVKKSVLYSIWDKYFEKGDPFMLFTMVLVFLINCSEELLKMDEKPKILDMLSCSVAALSAEDVNDFFELAEYFLSHTPLSVKQDFQRYLFGFRCASETSVDVSKFLALPVDARDLVRISSDENSNLMDQPFSFFVVDGRSIEEYMAGHIDGSYNLDCQLFADHPEKYAVALSSLDEFRRASRPNDHLLFLGSGHSESDLYLNMVVANFLQRGTKHVAIVEGGYKALHTLVSSNLELLDGHCPQQCKECCSRYVEPSNQKASWKIGFDNILDAVKLSAPTICEKLRLITQIPVTSRHVAVDGLVHVETNQRHEKRYRNERSIFTLSDSESEAETSTQNSSFHGYGSKRISDILAKDDILEYFDGVEIISCDSTKKIINCFIALTRTHIHVLQQSDKGDEVVAHSRYAYESVLRVASKKKIPEMLTFKFGYCIGDDEYKVTDLHRFVLPRAGECAKAIKMNIVNLRPSALE